MKTAVLGVCLLAAAAAGAKEIEYVDLGLSVLWSTGNSGISGERPQGDYYTWTDAVQAFSSDTEGRMASKAEWDELLDLCSRKWTTVDDVQGYLFTSKVKGFTDRSIFIPAAGWLENGELKEVSRYASYWSSTPGVQPGNSAAYGFNFQRGTIEWHSENRYSEQSVRLVRPLTGKQVTKVSLDRKKLAMEQHTSDRLKATMAGGRRNVNSACTWTTSDEKVVSVSADGLLVAHTPGVCTVTASAYGQSAQCAVTVTENEYSYVDLGLSVLWATRNLGARDSSAYGDYYAWAEIEPKEFFSWSNYRYCSFPGQTSGMDKYVTDGYAHQYLPADNLTRLLPEDDAATVLLGSDWHIPTENEIEELKENCRISDTVTAGGITCAVVTSMVPGYEGRSIYLPLSGQYSGNEPMGVDYEFVLWSSTGQNTRAVRFVDEWKWFETRSSYTPVIDRYYGLNIRPVRRLGDEQFAEIGFEGNLTDMSYGEIRPVSLLMESVGRSIMPDKIEWEASDPTMLQVLKEGYVIALRTGNCTLTARYEGRSITVPVTVTMPVPDAVDLGLSVKWASANLGAAKPQDQGAMQAWGETSVKPRPYTWDNYRHYSNGRYIKYYFGGDFSDGNVDFKEQLDAEDDAAHVLLGGAWRIPTAVELDELVRNCTWTEIEMDGVMGWIAASLVPGFEGRCIFLPYTECVEGVISEWNLNSRFNFHYRTSTLEVVLGDRFFRQANGEPVRPVQELDGQETAARKQADSERMRARAGHAAIPDAVDLGLSVLWASFNVGADSPEETGDFFAWGETSAKPYYTLYNYSRASVDEEKGYWWYDKFDKDYVLAPEDDAAHVNLGGEWRLPTKYECHELEEKCAWADTLLNGVGGLLVTSRVPGYEGNSIFLPFTHCETLFRTGNENQGIYMTSSASSRSDDRCATLAVYKWPVGTLDEFQSDIEMRQLHVSYMNPEHRYQIRAVRRK